MGNNPRVTRILFHSIFPCSPDWVVNVARFPKEPLLGAKIEIPDELLIIIPILWLLGRI